MEPLKPKPARASKSGSGNGLQPGPSRSPALEVQSLRLLPCSLPAINTSSALLPNAPPTPSPSPGGALAVEAKPADGAATNPGLPPSPPPPPELEEPPPMAPKNRPPFLKRPTELGELLTIYEMDQLYSLIVASTEIMRDNINLSFSAAVVPTTGGLKGPSATSAAVQPSYRMRGLGENFVEFKNTSENDFKASRKNNNAVLNIVQYSTVTPTLEALKKDVLLMHRRWQSNLLRRFREITIAEPAPAKENAPPGAGARGQKGSGSRGGGNKTPQFPAGAERTDAKLPMTESDNVLTALYPSVHRPSQTPVPGDLAMLPLAKRRLLLHATMLLVLSLEGYPAYSRILMLYLASTLHIPAHVLALDEVRVVKGLSMLAQEVCPEDAPTTRDADEIKYPRRGPRANSIVINLPIPLSSVGIGWVPSCGGVTPTIAAQLLGSLVESSIGVGTLFGFYGIRGAGKMVEAYNKEVADFAFVPLYKSPDPEFTGVRAVGAEHRRLRIVMAVGGWLMEKEDVMNVWCALGSQTEAYGVRWEAEQLDRMGWALETVAESLAWSDAKKEIADLRKRHSDLTPLSLLSNQSVVSIHEGCWPSSLLKVSKILDHPWNNCMARADKTGATLAEAIMHRVQGERGVTLIGYSLGARAIYTCLMALAERRSLGLVENVVMMGTPAPADGNVWSVLRAAVVGRLINVYSESDYMLAFLHRHSCTQFGVAGLQRIEKLFGVENINASALITDHLRYHYLVGTILKDLGLEDVDATKVSEREAELFVVEDRLDYEKRCGHTADAEMVFEQETGPASQALDNPQKSMPASATRHKRSKGKARNKTKKQTAGT